jgi:hypothetical protein
MARADKATTKPQISDPDRQQTRRQQPGAQGAGKEADALQPDGNVDESKLRQNQKRLRVDADHKTPAMRKQRRGTYP